MTKTQLDTGSLAGTLVEQGEVYASLLALSVQEERLSPG